MMRWTSIALLIFTSPLYAQRGSGHVGAAANTSSHAASASHPAFNFSAAPTHGFATPRFYSVPRVSTASHIRFTGASAYRAGGVRHGASGRYGYGSPLGYAGYGNSGYYLAPYEFGYASFGGFDDGYNPNVATQPEIRQGYAQNDPGPGYANQGYAAPPPANDGNAAPPSQSAPEYSAPSAYSAPAPATHAAPALEPEDAVTLIYKDGRSEQIHNYALTRTTLYITDKHHHDVPLSQIDLPATEKVNRDMGVDFALPQAR